MTIEALISVDELNTVLNQTYSEEEISPLIEGMSRAFNVHCNRKFTRRIHDVVLNSYGASAIYLPEGPVWAVYHLRYDTSRAFPESSAVDFTVFGRKLYTTAREIADDAYQCRFEAGYTVPDYFQEAEPAAPSHGQVWIHPRMSGMMVYDTASLSWAKVAGEAVPENIKLALIEYVTYYKRRLAAKGAGLIKVERGYSFEGSAVEFERTMPQHVADMLSDYVIP